MKNGRDGDGPMTRPYEPGDRSACLELFDSNVPEFFQAWERPAFEAFLDALPGSYLVVAEGTEVVACGGVAHEGGGVASISWTVVRRDRHGEGIGRHLLCACHAEARRLSGLERLRLETIPQVAPFFRKLGYHVASVEPDGYGPGMDRVNMETGLTPVNLEEKLSLIREHWSPRVVGELNGQHVKLAKLLGEFVWHRHDREDELFLVLKGELELHLRDGMVTLREGEFFVVPQGVEHKPVAREEVHLLLLEPTSTLNTGNVRSERTVETPEWI